MIVLDNKIRFITNVVDETIIIYNRAKDDLINELNELKFSDIDSLIKIPIVNFTEDEIEKLAKTRDKTLEKLNEYENITYKELWIQELKELKEKLNERR